MGAMECPNSVLRLRVERTSAERSNPAVHRLAALQSAAQIEKSDGRRKGMTVNTAMLICWLILLIVVLIVLELHIRSLTIHSSLSSPMLSSAFRGAVAIARHDMRSVFAPS
jgi:hypothetical protein